MMYSVIYGPVPSRRLGRSLGINNIPPKRCSYSCVYCQLGATQPLQIERRYGYDPQELAQRVRGKIQQVREQVEPVDYLAFVPDGEPTLDINLGKVIGLVRSSGIKTAVVTNASLIWREDVRQELSLANWVSLKVDAVTPMSWKKMNRPHGRLKLDAILNGMLDFAGSFPGELTTETMLIRGMNDSENEIDRIAEFLAEIKPATAYLAAPIRPPAESVEPATAELLNIAYQIFTDKLRNVEYLTGYEGNAFTATGSVSEDILSITAVHPMREEAVAELLDKAGCGWEPVMSLIDTGRLVELDYRGKKFYQRKLPLSKQDDDEYPAHTNEKEQSN